MITAAILITLALTTRPGQGALFAHYAFESNFVNNVNQAVASTSGITTPGFTPGLTNFGYAVDMIDNQGHEVWRNVAGQGLSFTNLTVAFWIRTTQANWRVPVTIEAQTIAEHKMALEVSAAGHIYLANPNGLPGATGIWTDPNPAAFVSDGNWHHVTWTANASANSSILYVDGVQVGSNTWGATAAVKLWMLGKLKGSVTKNFTGQLDEFRLYNIALNSDQVQYNIPVFGVWGMLALGGAIVYAARRKWRKQ
jgi:hypothetical protein